MGRLLTRECPRCGGEAKYVCSAGNVLRTVADVVLAFVAVDFLRLWFRCRQCGHRFKAH